MDIRDRDEDLAILEGNIKLLAGFRKQLFEDGSIVLTIAEHDQALNHLANTLFAFKLFIENDPNGGGRK